MDANWQFLLGILLPAYGFGYVWLIRTAREDPVMYAEVDRQLFGLLWALLFALFVVMGISVPLTGVTPGFKQEVWSAGAILIFLTSMLLQSFPFFRRIAALPPKKEKKAATESGHIESPTEEIG